MGMQPTNYTPSEAMVVVEAALVLRAANQAHNESVSLLGSSDEAVFVVLAARKAAVTALDDLYAALDRVS